MKKPTGPFPGANYELWSYEWSKYGTCSLTVFPSPDAYFSTALDLNEKYEINVSMTRCWACM
jgi:ribonuclease I